jgi:hypothetical protein
MHSEDQDLLPKLKPPESEDIIIPTFDQGTSSSFHYSIISNYFNFSMLLLLPTLKASIFNCIAKVRFTYFFD